MADLEKVTLFKDELEALKLGDCDGLTQEDVGREMGVSRGTAQRILASARRKVALSLSQGKAILFEQ